NGSAFLKRSSVPGATTSVTGVVLPPETRMLTALPALLGALASATTQTSLETWGNNLRMGAGTVVTGSRNEYPCRSGCLAATHMGFRRCSYPTTRPLTF